MREITTISESKQPSNQRLNKPVFYFSAGGIVIFCLFTIAFNQTANHLITEILDWVINSFTWYYLASATCYMIFVIYIAFSRFGQIKMGPANEKPEFSLISWSAMLFSAGIGIDLIFFSIAEPISQYVNPPVGQGSTLEAARQAVVWSLFHYGLTGWSMYALIGMALGYLTYRFKLPLAIKSALYPLFGKKINGTIGYIVEIAAVIGTIFGIATTCGIGIVQLNYGLHLLIAVPENMIVQILLILFAVTVSIISISIGLNKGFRILSQINIIVSIVLLIYILLLGNTNFLLNALIQNFGDYLSKLPAMSLNSFAYEQPTAWLKNWTVFFWAWWVAWSPFVGLFLARISRGRTIREFICGTLILPLIFTLTWLSIFGNSALYSIIFEGNSTLLETVLIHPERGFYDLLTRYPGFAFIGGIATIAWLLCYITTANSGAIVLGSFTTQNLSKEQDPPKWLGIFWAIVIGLLTITMLLTNGILALQNTTILMGLPFSLIIILIIASLIKSFKTDPLNSKRIKSVE